MHTVGEVEYFQAMHERILRGEYESLFVCERFAAIVELSVFD